MATLEYINKRIEGKTKEIGKLEAKLARIQKAQATPSKSRTASRHLAVSSTSTLDGTSTIWSKGSN